MVSLHLPYRLISAGSFPDSDVWQTKTLLFLWRIMHIISMSQSCLLKVRFTRENLATMHPRTYYILLHLDNVFPPFESFTFETRIFKELGARL